MRKLLLAAALLTTLAACAPNLHQAYAQCHAEALKAAPEDDDPDVDACMAARGFEIRDGDCSLRQANRHATPQRCFRPKTGPG